MKKMFCFAALVVGVSYVSLGATTSVPKPDGLVDLTDDTASRVTSTSTGEWLKGPGTAFHNKGAGNKNADFRVIKNVTALNFIYTFDEPTCVNGYAFCMFDNGMPKRAPLKWNIYGSNTFDPGTKDEPDGTWTLVDSRDNETEWGVSEYRYFAFNNGTAYKSYKVDILSPQDGHDNYIQFNFMEFFFDLSVILPVFGECSFVSEKDGEYELSGVITANEPTALSLILTPEGGGDAKSIVLDTPEVGVPFARTVSATVDDLSATVWYSAKLVAENANGSSEKQLGRCWFGPSPRPTLYAKKIEFTVSDSIGETLGESTMTDFPVLVRLSSVAIDGFDSADFLQSGRDLLFTDEDGNRLSFELDTFDPDGETLVWVKIPSLSASTKFTCYYGGPENALNDPTDVWSGYLGVWHYNTVETTVPNATANANLDATATSAATALSGDATPFGSAAVQGGAGYSVADYEPAYSVGNKFSVSGWFKMPSYEGTSGKYATWVTKKTGLGWNATSGWYLQMNQSKTKCGLVESGSTETMYSGLPDVTQNWIYFHYVNDGGSEKVYFNGSMTPGINKSGGSIKASTTVFQMLAASQQGDEFRLSKSTWSALRTSLEYNSMKNVDFLSNSGSSAMDVTAPVFETPVVTVSNDGTVSVSITVTAGEGDVYLMVDGEKVEPKLGTIGTDITIGTPIVAHPTIEEDACATIAAYGINANGTEVTKYADGGAMNAAVEAVVTDDANERGLVPGVFAISRPNGVATDLPIVVNLSWEGGTAVQGKNYASELPATVTIPAGAASTTVVVTPIRDAESQNDETIVLTVAAGAYKSGATATMKILNLVTDPNYNTWVAAADGLASDGANWSKGVPQSDHKILFDPQFSNANCEWDGGVNGLATSVAEWTQAEGFTGTVTIDTAYDGSFKTLAISGDAVVNGGKWTQKANSSVQVYRLKVSVGGDFTLGAGASVNLQGKGYSGGSLPTGVHAAPVSVSSAGWSEVRGDVREPSEIGACGASGYPGGGAFWLEVTGSAVVDGSITVRGADNSGVQSKASAAPGSIYIKAKSLGGAGSMNASAIACNQANSKGASGGRVSIVLTGAVAMDFDEANITAKGCNCSTAGGAGTILIKTTTTPNFGRLIIDTVANGQTYVVRYQSRYAATCVPPGETWELDEIHFRGSGVLSIPPNATLELKGPLTKITGDTSTAGNHGIIYMGGTFTFTHATPDVITGGWRFMPDSPFTFDGDLTIGANGSVGCFNLRDNYTFGADGAVFQKCDLTVTGDLILSGGGSINATGGSGNLFSSIFSSGGAMRGASHGGLAKDAKSLDFVYDSVFNPRWPGMCADSSGDTAYETTGGGAVKLTVGGCLTLDSKATIAASGVHYQNKSGAGGSIDIRCGQINMDPAASISVNSPSSYSWSGDNTGYPGGAGRIALRIATANPALPAHKITANGYTSINGVDKAGNTQHASAGTVYIENGAEMSGKGEVKVGNDNKTYNVLYTPIPSRKWGGENDDWRGASLIVTNCGQVVLTSNLRLRELSMSAAGRDKLDLNGNTMTVDRAFMKSLKLSPGTYTTNDTEVADILLGDGSLVVTGGGFVLYLR